MYLALQAVCDSSGVSCEALYKHLKRDRGLLHLAPQLLLNVRRARKLRKMKAKLKIIARTKVRKIFYSQLVVMGNFRSSSSIGIFRTVWTYVVRVPIL